MSATRRHSLKLMGAFGAVLVPSARSQNLSGGAQNLSGDAQNLSNDAQHLSGDAHHIHPPDKPPPVPAYTPNTFTAAEGAVVARIADLIIPATETPGALAAGAPQFIDTDAAADPAHRLIITEGIRWIDTHAQALHGQPFVALTGEQQIAILTPLSAPGPSRAPSDGAALFRTLKDLTVDCYYTSYAGLVEELNYQGNQMLAAFPGCGHEH